MAYVDFASDAMLSPYAGAPRVEVVATQAARLSALEWSVVALARYDRLSSLSQPGRVAVALGKVFGTRANNLQLADPRLEALRRMAVLSWRRGENVAAEELAAFRDAGFTAGQYRLVLDSIAAAALPEPRLG